MWRKLTNLSTINRIINSSDALNNTSDKNWILNANISIANNATLFINSTDTQWLRINSTAPQPFSIVAYGNLVINGTRIGSWNSTSITETVLKNDTNESTPAKLFVDASTRDRTHEHYKFKYQRIRL